GQDHTSNQLNETITGKRIRFTNIEQEWPIGEFGVYYVHQGAEPEGVAKLAYTLTARDSMDNPSIQPLRAFIAGRVAPDERATMIAAPGNLVRPGRANRERHNGPVTDFATRASLPIVHIIIPADLRGVQGAGHGGTYGWENMRAGLDGIAIDLPALQLKPTHGDLIPMNIEIKDPLWPMRDMLD